MRRTLWYAAVAIASTLGVSCGGGSGPAAPTSPTVTGITLTVIAPAVGLTVQATATATLSNGTISPVTSGFGGDNSAVATVSPSGAVTGVGTGAVTVWADYQGVRATKLLQVLPNYAGTFSGSYVASGCQATGAWLAFDFCSNISQGQVLAIGMVNTQSADLRSVTGTITLGGLSGNGSGSVAQNGTLTYSGTVLTDSTIRIDLQNWSSNSPNLGVISGSFEQQWSDPTIGGTGRVFCTNLNLTRTAGGTSSSRRSIRSATLADVFSLLRQR